MKRTILIMIIIFCFGWVCSMAQADEQKSLIKGYDFYFFGINLETFKTKNLNYPAAILGGITAAVVHLGGHYAYAGMNHMSVTQHGFEENVAAGYSAQQYREFASAGHIAQALGGLLLTSIPVTRQTSFTKGYVIWEAVETISYPLIWHGNDGDLNMSKRYGGSGWEEVGYDAIAIHNLLRINWKD